MSDEKYDHFFLSTSSEIPETNKNLQESKINYYSVPPISDDQLKLWLQNAPFMEEMLQDQDDHHRQSSFEFEKNTCLDYINLNKSSHTERKRVEIQTKENDGCEDKKEVGEREDQEECKQRKRKRSNEVQNQNERLRRKKLSKKMKALQDIIPSSSKVIFRRDQASTIDEAIKYIRTLKYQVQMTSTGAGYSLFHSPPSMMPQPGHTHSFSPFLQPGHTTIGMKYGNETGASDMFFPFNFPTSRFGLHNPCLFPSSSSSGAANSIQNGGRFLGCLCASGCPYLGSQSNKQGETSSSHDAKEMHKS